MIDDNQQSSSGHKLGQLVGDWFQDYFVTPLLQEVAGRLRLYLDHRNNQRQVRGDKILWRDDDNNVVDYDFVLELNGNENQLGIPVAFLESFWRRGARHSKDKARDDSGKLMPMRSTYPTARFLGIVACGEFTRPASELVWSRNIDLFYVPKAKVIEAFLGLGLIMDYNDKANEETKAGIANAFERLLTEEIKLRAAEALRGLMGEMAIKSYVTRVQAALSTAPVEFRIVSQLHSKPMVFETVEAVADFLRISNPEFDFSNPDKRFSYQVNYSDGTEFFRYIDTVDDLKILHSQITTLVDHMTDVLRSTEPG